ncbi:hypothetical protein RSAG8_13791, partial [Rhizoctonia solani AG-8 WAC10335]
MTTDHQYCTEVARRARKEASAQHSMSVAGLSTD